MRESKVERKVVEYAKKSGWLSFKFISVNHKGLPDRLFIKEGVTIFVEFKKPDAKLSPIQVLRIEEMEEVGATVYVIDNITDGKAIFDAS